MWTPVSTSARPHPTRTLLILGVAALSYAIAQTSIVPAIGDLIRVFHTDAAGVAWTLTAYLASAAVFTPVLGRLGDMFGKKRMLVIALGVFAAGNVLAALAGSLEMVVAGRVLQGTGGGIFPLCFAIIRDEFPRERVRASIGLISATAGIGGGLGLVLGGLLVDHASYHWIFWVGGAGAAAAAVAAYVLVPESPNRRPGKVDVRGAVLLGVGLLLPLLAISKANVWGWTDARTLGLTLAGLAVLAIWVAVQRRTAEPLANIATLARRPVLMTNVATLLTGFGMFGSFILVPQLAEAPVSTGYGFGASATHAGLLMLPGALIMLFAGPVSGMLGERFGSRVPLGIGGLIAAVGLALLGVLHGTELEVAVFSAVMFTGIGLAFSAMPNLIVDAVSPAETGEATGFNALVRSVGSSLGSQVSGAILAGTIVAGGSPSDAGFRTAFLVSAGIALVAAAMAMIIPAVSGEHAPHLSALGELGAAGPLGEPAYAGER
ncbi:MAG: transporter [Solirubrobacterales bacterium]|nr:transporter [Solirubrobacterales bacterium]